MLGALLFAPLIAAHVASPLHAREVHARGLVVRASATAAAGVTPAELDVSYRGRAQHIDLAAREVDPQVLLRSVDIVDANFDGHPDIVVLREFGAKWSRMDVFLFDPKVGRFTATTGLSRAISALSNATFDDVHKMITTRDIGPSNPTRITWAIDGAKLRVVDACRFINPSAERVGTLVRTHAGTSTYKNVRLAAFDVEPCGL